MLFNLNADAFLKELRKIGSELQHIREVLRQIQEELRAARPRTSQMQMLTMEVDETRFPWNDDG